MSDRVRVLHVLRTLGFGGMERMLRNVIRGLNQRGIESAIALVSNEEELLDFGGLAELHRVRARPRDPRPAIELGALIRRLGPTVLHARNFSIWPDAALARTLSRTGVPLVVSYHGADPGGPPFGRRVLVRGLVEVTDRVFAVSEAAKALVAETYAIPADRIGVIPNGVDTARFSPRPEAASAGGRFRIGNVGRLYKVKNLALLLRAGEALRRRRLDFEIAIAGDGPELDVLEALARTLEIADRVRFLGRTEDVPSLLRTFDVFALTSDLEGHPNALLEAMATGLPCIATRIASVPEALDGGRAGILIAPGDQLELADAVERLAADPALRKKLGEAARQRAVGRYGQEKTIDAYEALYRGLSERARPRMRRPPPRAEPDPPRSAVGDRPRYRIVLAEPIHLRAHLRLLRRYVTPVNAVERFRWLYRANPQGQAHTWLALEPERGEIVGFTSIFGRGFAVDGERVLGGVGLDAFVRPDHRRRGIAAMLHRASFESMTNGEVPIRFMCGPPVAANYNALLKVGSKKLGQVRYLHLPLSVPGLLRSLHFDGVADRLESAVQLERIVHGIWKAVLASRRRVEARYVERTTREFDRLWNDVSPSEGVMGLRDEAFVRWRYLENPVCTQQVVAVEERGRLLGWAVLELGPRGALIADSLLPLDPDEAALVLRAVLRLALELDAPSVAVFTHAATPTNEVFMRSGFLRGRSASDFQVMCGDPALARRLMVEEKWTLRAGDLDPESCHWSVPATPAVWTDPNFVSTEAEMRRIEREKR
jgi:glycosyltransferase involved in cell wall biosynthesis/GNAT superfamily N-acetyltransferase